LDRKEKKKKNIGDIKERLRFKPVTFNWGERKCDVRTPHMPKRKRKRRPSALTRTGKGRAKEL